MTERQAWEQAQSINALYKCEKYHAIHRNPKENEWSIDDNITIMYWPSEMKAGSTDE